MLKQWLFLVCCSHLLHIKLYAQYHITSDIPALGLCFFRALNGVNMLKLPSVDNLFSFSSAYCHNSVRASCTYRIQQCTLSFSTLPHKINIYILSVTIFSNQIHTWLCRIDCTTTLTSMSSRGSVFCFSLLIVRKYVLKYVHRELL